MGESVNNSGLVEARLDSRRRLAGSDFHGAELHLLLLSVNPSSVTPTKGRQTVPRQVTLSTAQRQT
ncbi:hypothetical protein I79_017363 [Cricetulus griseus]|uniref:Uncharacterized protein n=1 Tax=Cricetulus griseus TaxID=10029 RepID=G3I1U5_CRIGR|nr:hypothetical protein I79_017363 [Cricetulus griseus]